MFTGSWATVQLLSSGTLFSDTSKWTDVIDTFTRHSTVVISSLTLVNICARNVEMKSNSKLSSCEVWAHLFWTIPNTEPYHFRHLILNNTQILLYRKSRILVLPSIGSIYPLSTRWGGILIADYWLLFLANDYTSTSVKFGVKLFTDLYYVSTLNLFRYCVRISLLYKQNMSSIFTQSHFHLVPSNNILNWLLFYLNNIQW